MVDGHALFSNRTSHDVNATVDGDEDRGATTNDLGKEVEATGGPVDANRGNFDQDSPPAEGEATDKGEEHGYEGPTKGARTHVAYEGQEDRTEPKENE